MDNHHETRQQKKNEIQPSGRTPHIYTTLHMQDETSVAVEDYRCNERVRETKRRQIDNTDSAGPQFIHIKDDETHQGCRVHHASLGS